MHLTSSSSNFKPFSLPKWDWKTQDQVSRQKKLSDLLCWEPVTTSLERTTPLETYWMVWNHRQKEFKLSWEHERFCTCVDTRWFLIVTKEGTVGAIYFLMIESWLYFYRISIIVHILIWHTQIRSQHYLWWQDSVFMDTARRSAFCASLRRCCGEEQRWIIIPIRCPWIQFEQVPPPPPTPKQTPTSPLWLPIHSHFGIYHVICYQSWARWYDITMILSYIPQPLLCTPAIPFNGPLRPHTLLAPSNHFIIKMAGYSRASYCDVGDPTNSTL